MLTLQMKQYSESKKEDYSQCQTFQTTLQLESYQKLVNVWGAI